MTGTLDEVTTYMNTLYASGELGGIQMKLVPEPATMTLSVIGVIGSLAFLNRRRKR